MGRPGLRTLLCTAFSLRLLHLRTATPRAMAMASVSRVTGLPPGPFPVGVTTMQLDDLTRQDPESGPRSLQTETGCRLIGFIFVSFVIFCQFSLARFTSQNYMQLSSETEMLLVLRCILVQDMRP